METRGLLWVTGKVESGIIDVSCNNGQGKASLEIIRASSKIIPEIKDNNIHITVKIYERGNLGSQTCPKNFATPSKWSSLQKLQSKAIRNEVQAAVDKAKLVNADIFGFGDAVHKKYPKAWRDLENRWDEFFPELEVTIIVKSTVLRPGYSQ